MKPDVGLSFQILSYCIQKVLAEDRDSLLAEGLSVDAIRVIETLTFRELAHLSRLDPRFLGMTLDPKGFLTALQYVRQETDMVIMQDEMLRRRAPFPMMQALFGMTSLQYANRRKLLGIAGVGIGRPVRPSEEANWQVWHAWRQHAELPERQRYLAVSRATELPLHTIWTLVKEWQNLPLASRDNSRSTPA